jgi:acyl carrier protein
MAYVVGKGGQEPDAGEMRDFLGERLPRYMIPSAFVMLEELPLTPNGKVDRRALSVLDATRLDVERAFVGPRTPAEEVLVGIWAEVLGIERVGVHDSFFELGGHSLLATQVISRIQEAFQVTVPLRTLFETPTVASLAQIVDALTQAGSSTMISEIVSYERLEEVEA